MSAQLKPSQSRVQHALTLAAAEATQRLESSRRRGRTIRAAGRGRWHRCLRHACIGSLVAAIVGDQALDQWLFCGSIGGCAGLILAAYLEVRRVLAR